jgi:hypothetical protein
MTLPIPLQPPAIFDLEWSDGEIYFIATATAAFVAADEAAYLMGIRRPRCLEQSGNGIFFNPRRYDAAEMEIWRAAATKAIDDLAARRAAEASEHAASEMEKRKRYHDYAGPRHAAAVRAAIAEGHALYAEHGVAIRKVKPLLDLLDLVYLEPRELTRLRKIIRECRDNVANMEGDAVALAKPSDVYLDDDFVERAVRLLTDLDRDRSKEANLVGWGRDTSAPGHWCCALLRTDRARAIEIGRGLVAHHLVQLAKLGLKPIGERAAA